jgi:HSP20 family protein
MTLVKYQTPFPNLFDRLFDDEFDFWNRRNFALTQTTVPSVNIKETTEGFEVEVAAPGFDKSDFNIEIDNDVLTISSEKQVEDEVKEDEKFTKREFSYQAFSRSFSLPETVNGDKITARYDNGILKINIPKKEEAKPKPARQIKIK